MKNFRFRSQDNPEINGDVDRLEEIYAHLTLAGHYPKKVLIVCSICDGRIVTGPRGASDPTAQGAQDRAWAKEHIHPVRKWWRRNFPVKVGIAAMLLTSLLAAAQSGTPSMLYSTWNGIPRQTVLYVPPNFHPGSPLVIVLHGTAVAPPSQPPTGVYHFMGWDQLSDANQILVAQPIASYKTISGSRYGGSFFWESIGTESYFPADPDDSGFLANLVTTLQQQYQTDPKRTFVMGFSSGGMMTQTMAIQHAELFAAAAPFSGTVWVNNPNTLTLPSQPVSIIEFHGDVDTTIPYCGGLFNGWGEKSIVIPSVDVDLNYWLAADGLPASSSSMCSSGLPAAPSFDSGPAKVEVQVVREYSFAHAWHQPEIAMAWAFFSTHGR